MSGDPVDEVRLLLARERERRGLEAPTLGRFFPDTPGVFSPDDEGAPLYWGTGRPRYLTLVPLEEWAEQGTPAQALSS